MRSIGRMAREKGLLGGCRSRPRAGVTCRHRGIRMGAAASGCNASARPKASMARSSRSGTRYSARRSPGLVRLRPARAPLPCRRCRTRATRPRRQVSPPPLPRAPRLPPPAHGTIAAHGPVSSAARRARVRPQVRRGNTSWRQRSRLRAARTPEAESGRRMSWRFGERLLVRRARRSRIIRAFRQAGEGEAGSARWPCATFGRHAMRVRVSRARRPIRRRPARTVRS